MELIKPSQISGEIMTLIEEADEKVIIVSPYCKISKWYKLIKKFEDLRKRGISIEFYVREGEQETIDEVIQIGIEPFLVPNLHCKLYLNEKIGIVSSMNLLLSSEINSLEIAYKTGCETEHNELISYYNRYIKSTIELLENKVEPMLNWRELFYNKILNHVGKQIYVNEDYNRFEINAGGSKYQAFIASERTRMLRINGILSYKEFQTALKIKKDIEDNTGLKIELIEGRNGHYDTIWGTIKQSLKSEIINEPHASEELMIADSLASFVNEVYNLKTGYKQYAGKNY